MDETAQEIRSGSRVNAASARLDRLLRVEEVMKTIAIGLTAVLVIISIVMSVATLNRLSEIKVTEHQSACIAQKIAAFAAATGDAFNSPPAPNPAREVAVQKITEASKALKHPLEGCHL